MSKERRQLPPIVIVMGIAHYVKLVDQIDDSDDVGKIDYLTRTIRILNSLRFDEQVATLIHEMTHAGLHLSGRDHLMRECYAESLCGLMETVFRDLVSDLIRSQETGSL